VPVVTQNRFSNNKGKLAKNIEFESSEDIYDLDGETASTTSSTIIGSDGIDDSAEEIDLDDGFEFDTTKDEFQAEYFADWVRQMQNNVSKKCQSLESAPEISSFVQQGQQQSQ